MGFFSWSCPECDRSVISVHAITRTSPEVKLDPEFSKATLVLPDRVLSGEYDGYGRLDDFNILDNTHNGEEPHIFHTKCYALAGRPKYEETQSSPMARDQGFFLECNDYRKLS